MKQEDFIAELVNRAICLEQAVIRLHNDMSRVLMETGKLMEMVKSQQLYGLSTQKESNTHDTQTSTTKI